MHISNKLKEFVDYHQRHNLSSFPYRALRQFIYPEISFDFAQGREITSRKRLSKITDNIDIDDDGFVLYDEGKQKMRIGKLITTIIKHDFRLGIDRGINWEIENIVNSYKSWVTTHNKSDKLKFVTINGKDIINKGYNSEHYVNTVSGTLAHSCMTNRNKILKLYSRNKNKVSLLTLQDDKGKINARALVWKLDYPKGEIFMDRVYSYYDYMVDMFREYAREKGWNYREQAANDFKDIHIPSLSYKTSKVELVVKLRTFLIKRMPYMDTFRYYDKERKVFSNYASNFDIISIDSTRGTIIR